MTKDRVLSMLSLLARILVGSVLIYAGFIKAVGPSAEFAAMIAAYKILPTAWTSQLAMLLPYIEMWVGVFVVAGLFTRRAAAGAMGLFATFFIALVSAKVRGIDLVSCGCFGADSLSPKVTLIMDTFLWMASFLIYTQSKLPPPVSLDREFP